MHQGDQERVAQTRERTASGEVVAAGIATVESRSGSCSALSWLHCSCFLCAVVAALFLLPLRCRCCAVLASSMQEDCKHEVSTRYSSSRIGNPEEQKSDKESFGSDWKFFPFVREPSLRS